MSELTHKTGMPIGWVNRDGRNLPVFVCSKTGKPISPENPGTLYWDPETGDMVVLSEAAEAKHGEPDLPYSTELDVHSLALFLNTAGADGSESQRAARENLKETSMI
jgi:hypothetical protein